MLSAKLNLSKHSRTTDTRSGGAVNFIENNSVDNHNDPSRFAAGLIQSKFYYKKLNQHKTVFDYLLCRRVQSNYIRARLQLVEIVRP